MERLLEIARGKVDKVEVFSQTTSSDLVSFENGRLKNVESSILSGVGLTLIKDGKLGTAYTRNLTNREELVENALASMSGGVEADYEPAGEPVSGETVALDPAIQDLTSEKMVEECSRIIDAVRSRTEGQISSMSQRGMTTVRVLTSEGFDGKVETSSYSNHLAVHYPGSYSSVNRAVTGKSFMRFPDDDIDYVVDTFNASEKEITPRGGPTKVVFLPECMYTLIWRLAAATTGQTVYQKVSPLREKLGEQVLSPKLTLTDAPLDDSQPGARSFDDEGTPCRDRAIFENGLLRGFYTDRYFSWKLGEKPTGNGWRQDVTARPSPGLKHLRIEPGELSLAEMLDDMKQGVIVAGALGAHSGNILNGDYSIGLSPGLWVEDGRVVGHVKDAMIAGNVYDDLQRVVAVGKDLYSAHTGRFPAIVLDGVSFSTRG